MISKIIVENFQSHKHSELELSEEVNAIIAPSNEGKSSLFRAIELVRTNRPLGEEYISWGTGDCYVTIKTKEGNLITRKKTKDSNEYIINKTSYKSFGASPPQQVQETLNIKDINYQSQSDRHFLLPPFYSAGQIASILNEVIGIDDIDRVRKYLKEKENEANRELKESKTNLTKIKKAKELFKDIGEHELIINTAEMLETDIVLNRKKYKQLIGLLQSISSIRVKIIALNRITSLEKNLLKAEKRNAIIQELIKKQKQLIILKEKIEEQRETIKQKSKTVSTLQKEIKITMPKICPLCGRSNKYAKI